jgi:predicted nucleic acid-binding protein
MGQIILGLLPERRADPVLAAEVEQVLALIDRFRAGWLEILPSEEVRKRAARLLRVHALNAADALQLTAARVWASDVANAELVTLDERLALAARLEGFRILPAR